MRQPRALQRSSLASRVATTLALATVLLAPPAAAQSPGAPLTASPAAPLPPHTPTPAETARAKKLFQDGKALLAEGLYPQAIAAFTESIALVPRKNSQQNIAVAYRKSKDLAGAYREYDVLLDRYGEQMSSAEKAAVMRVLEDLSPLIGTVVVSVTEPGVAVSIDGAEVARTPVAKPIRVNLGAHKVVLEKAGFEPLTQNIEAKGHDTFPIAGPMQAEILTGHVTVAVQPADPTTKVFVDGAPVGPAPWAGDLLPGPHTIVAKSDTMATEPNTITVVKKVPVELNLTQIAQIGTLAVKANLVRDPGTPLRGAPVPSIMLDGNVVGQGAIEAPFPAGQHDLVVQAPGFVSVRMSVNLVAGQKTSQFVDLLPAPVVAPPHDWTGVYSSLTFMPLIGLTTPSNDIAQGVGYTPDTQITGGKGVGGGLNVRVGYSFGYIGVEGSAIGEFDYSSANASVKSQQNSPQHPACVTPAPGLGAPYPACSSVWSYTDSYSFYRGGGDLTAGIRVRPKFQVVRPSLGLGGGVAIKAMVYSRSVNTAQTFPTGGVSPNYSSGITPYVAPVFSADLGVEIGRTPGTRFYLGALMLAEFDPATQASGVDTSTITPATALSTTNKGNPTFPAGAINVVHGTEVFLGPFLGMQFGE